MHFYIPEIPAMDLGLFYLFNDLISDYYLDNKVVNLAFNMTSSVSQYHSVRKETTQYSSPRDLREVLFRFNIQLA